MLAADQPPPTDAERVAELERLVAAQQAEIARIVAIARSWMPQDEDPATLPPDPEPETIDE